MFKVTTNKTRETSLFRSVNYQPEFKENKNSKKDISLAYSTTFENRPVKTNAISILWVRPEDTLASLFIRASKYVQSQKNWESEDYANAIREMLKYLHTPISESFIEYARVNSYFLSKRDKDEVIKKIGNTTIRRVFKVPSDSEDVPTHFYVLLQNTKHINSKYEGITQVKGGMRFVHLNSDLIIGKVEIWNQFCQYLDQLVSEISRPPMSNFDFAIEMVKKMLFRGLIVGEFSNDHHNYSIVKESADALPRKFSKDFMDLSKWTTLPKVQGYAYRLFARFIAMRFPHVIRSKAPNNVDYRNFGSSVLYVLDSTKYEKQTPKRKKLFVPDSEAFTTASNPFSKIEFTTRQLKEKTSNVLVNALIDLFKYLPIVKRKPALLFTTDKNSYDRTTNQLKVAVNTVNGISAPDFVTQYARVINAQYYKQTWYRDNKKNLGNYQLVMQNEVFAKIAKTMNYDDTDFDKAFGIGFELYLKSISIDSILLHKQRTLAVNEKYRLVQFKYELAIIHYFAEQFPGIEKRLSQTRLIVK